MLNMQLGRRGGGLVCCGRSRPCVPCLFSPCHSVTLLPPYPCLDAGAETKKLLASFKDLWDKREDMPCARYLEEDVAAMLASLEPTALSATSLLKLEDCTYMQSCTSYSNRIPRHSKRNVSKRTTQGPWGPRVSYCFVGFGVWLA